MRNNYVYFDGKSSLDFKAFITDAGVYKSPAHSYEKVSVPGRNGDLLIENDKYENIEHSYPMVIIDEFDHNFDALKAYFLSKKGYLRLSDTFHPDEFYKATFSRFENIRTTIGKKMGSFVVVFDRKPQKYLKSGEKTYEFTQDGSIKNPTLFDALPLIRVYGVGGIRIGGILVMIESTTATGYIDLDCEMQEAYCNGVYCNDKIELVNGDFPKLSAGINEIAFIENASQSIPSRVIITPNWWRV